jgi:fluoroacetyl-CoA thioesterase
MMKTDLRPGLRLVQTLRIEPSLTVPAASAAFPGFADMPPVLATAYLVAFIEWTCIEALRPSLDLHARTVGTRVDVSHVAATPVGMLVTAAVELVAVEGRRLRFKVACHDEDGLIGEGFHERAIIDYAKFMARVAAKAEGNGRV